MTCKDPAQARPPRLQRADLIAAAVYLAVYWALELPGIDVFFDPHHQAYLLMTSVRIHLHQTPYVDFVPWYGPLFTYFTAAWVRLLGLDLLAVKLYLQVVSPLLSVIMLLTALRWFKVPPAGRVFAVLMSGLWAVDRVHYCGSTRPFLALLAVAFWVWGARRAHAAPWHAAAPFAVLVVWLFSPEFGLYLVPALGVFMAAEIGRAPAGSRRAAAGHFLAGLGAAAVSLVVIDLVTGGMIRRYQAYISYLSTVVWGYAMPFPEARDFVRHPLNLLYFATPLLYTAAFLTSARALWKGRRTAQTTGIMALAVFGGASWNTTYLRTSPEHLLMVLPPALVILGLAFARPSRRGWVQVGLLAVVIAGVPFFNAGDNRMLGFERARLERAGELPGLQPFMGIRDVDDLVWDRDDVKRFMDAQPGRTFLFPLSTFDGYALGLPPRMPLDVYQHSTYAGLPESPALAVERLRPDYVVLERDQLLWLINGDDLDPLMDYLAAHYEPEAHFEHYTVYSRLAEPREPYTLVGAYERTFVLGRDNDFSEEWSAPPGFDRGFVEVEERFEYGWDLLPRLSVAEAKAYADGYYLARRQRHGHGREQIDNTPAGGGFRVYLPAGTHKFKLRIEFPGVLNARPQRVVIQRVSFYNFAIDPDFPFTQTFFAKGY